MFDHIIVGGGTAGCVLAARLSEHSSVSVILIEAGRDISASDAPPEVRAGYPAKAYFDQNLVWSDLRATMGAGRRDGGTTRSRYEQARLLGGGSSINGMLANRGGPTDYDEWERLGAKGWAWSDVLPYFIRLERDLQFDGPFHGSDGPQTIGRIPAEAMSPFVRAVASVLGDRGFPLRDDQNGEWDEGIFRTAVSMDENGDRAPVAMTYLSSEVRARANLTILTDTKVERLVLEGNRAIGVDVLRSGAKERLLAHETVVCAGAIHSPVLLMRSGIGPRARLERHSIPVVRDLPGVGENLNEHPSCGISCYLTPGGRWHRSGMHHVQAHYRFSSGMEGCPPIDMNAAILARSAWHALGARMGSFFFWVNKSYSRGTVRLADASPAVEPSVDFRLLSDRRDMDRLKCAFRKIASIAADPGLDSVRTTSFPTAYSDRVRRVSSPGVFNAMQMRAFSSLLDWAKPAREWLIHRFVTEGRTLAALTRDDDLLEDYLTDNVTGTWHASGTCRMGREDDPAAVTDASGRVLGLQRLRICDASLMPTVPCANTNIPTIMVAEKIADQIKCRERSSLNLVSRS